MRVDYIIRQAQEKDLAELYLLHRQILELEGISHSISDEELKTWYSTDTLSSHFILLSDNKIVSHIEVQEKAFSYDGITLKCGILSGVHTHPDYRGKGLALNLLRECFRYMKKNEMTFSMVLSGIKHFYQSSGYELYPLHVYPAFLNELAERFRKYEGPMGIYQTFPYDGERFGDAIYEIYRKNNVLVPLDGKYSEAYWRHLKSDEDKNCIFLAARKDGNTVGFLGAQPFGYYADDLVNVNILVDPEERGAAVSLLSKFVEKFRDGRFSRVVILVNAGMGINKKIEDSLLLEPRFESATMFKIIDLGNLIEKLLPSWTERIKQAGISFQGTIEIECAGIKVEVDFGEEKLSINKKKYSLRESYLNRLFEKTETSTIYLPLTQRTFFLLFFRQISPQDLLIGNTLHLDRQKLAVLESLFC